MVTIGVSIVRWNNIVRAGNNMVKIICDICEDSHEMEWKNGGWIKPPEWHRITIDYVNTKTLCDKCHHNYVEESNKFFNRELV